MNFAAKFDGFLSAEGVNAHGDMLTHVDTVSAHAPAGAIIVPDAQLLFTGDFKRSGVDLALSKDDRELVLQDYFKGEKRAALASPDGAHLTGDIVYALAGHVQLAQADGSASTATVIGHVTKLVGNATAIRNGVSIVLNQGDNVNKGDVVQSGSDSTLGITFIDGTVFGLGQNAKMVLNEMVYDPNGSNNSSLLSLVQGTISFVAGATAKHGDMKVDTPVATMGIRGTAVLVEIDFEVPGQGSAPPAKFQVLVEPDGTTGSYILFDKTTLTPIATVNQAGTQTVISGNGNVSFLSSVQLSPDAQNLINQLFAWKYTNADPNPKSDTHFTDTIVPQTTFGLKLADGTILYAMPQFVIVPDKVASSGGGGPGSGLDHIPGPPTVVTSDGSATERAFVTHNSTIDKVTGTISYADVNAGDVPTASATFDTFSYKDASNHDVTASLTAEQLAAIKAVEIPLQVTQDAAGINHGIATWTYSIADNAFDFLAAGETLTLTYLARVDNNFALNDEFTIVPITITITGTNDVPTIATSGGNIIERIGTGNTVLDEISGTVTFTDVDLTDRPMVSAALSSTEPFKYLDAQGHDVTATLTPEQLAAITAVEATLTVVQTAGNTHNGSATWTYSVPDHFFDFIADDETLILNYVAQVDDGHGGVISTPITVSINGADVSVVGTNDVPTIVAGSTTAIGELTEDEATTLAADGTITFQDLDLTDTHTATFVLKSSNANADLPGYVETGPLSEIGTFALTAVSENPGVSGIGSVGWTFTLPDNNPVLQSLAEGQTITQVYTVTFDDHHGGTVKQDVTVTITGTNDTPTITSNAAAASGAVTEDAATPTLSTGGTLAIQDLDLIDTHTATLVFKSSSSSTHLPGFDEGTTNIGHFTIDPSVNENNGDTDNGASLGWHFTLDDNDPVLQSLAEDQTITQVYTVTFDDHHGGTVKQDVTVTISGTNDAPTVVAGSTTAAGSVTEDTDVASGSIGTSGTITFQDVDLIDAHTASFVLKSSDAGADLPGFAEGIGSSVAHLGTFTLTGVSENTADATNTGSLGWTFTLDNNDPTLQSLALNQTITQIYTITVSDGHGGTVPQDVTVTITGTNDAPTIVAGSTVSGGVTEDTGVVSGDVATSGTITFQDVDLIDTHTASFVLKSSDAGADLPGFAEGVGPNVAHLGTFALTGVSENTTDMVNTGSLGWTFVLDNNDPTLQSLAAGQTITQVYTVTVADGHGGTVTQDVTVVITGTNDQPTVSMATAGGGVTEDTDVVAGNVSAVGAVTFADIDLIDLHTASVDVKSSSANADLPGFTEGSGSGFDHIGSFTLSMVSEDNTDTAETGSFGWTFTLGNGNSVLQSLALNQTITQVYAVTVPDGHGGTAAQDVTITITGANDAPTIVAASTTASGSVTEDANVDASGDIGSSGTIAFQDVDLLDTHTASFVLKSSDASADLPGFAEGSGSGAACLGTFTLTAVGENNAGTTNTASLGWTFTLDNNDPVLQSLALNQTITQVYTITVSDGHGGTVPQDVTVTIAGTNDAPTITSNAAAASGAVTEDASTPTLSAGGTLAIQDLDLIDTHAATSVFKSSSSSTHLPGFDEGTTNIGHFTIDHSVTENNGDTNGGAALGWHFTLDDNDPVLQSLAEGQTITQICTVAFDDHHDGTISQDVTVVITGTNDAPSIVAGSTTAAGGVAEDTDVDGSGNITTTGAITFKDVDLSDIHSGSVAFSTSSSSAPTPGFTAGSTHIGTFSIDASVTEDNCDTDNTGTLGWTFTLDDNDPTLQSLADGETITQVYTVTVTDNNGAFVSQDVTVTITGADEFYRVMATETWKGGTHPWDTRGQWVPSGTPTAGDDVLVDADTISANDTYTITIADDAYAHSLTVNAAEAKVEIVSGGMLTLGGDLTIIAGTFQIDSGGTLKATATTSTITGSFTDNGTVEVADGAILRVASETISGMGLFKIGDGATLQLDHADSLDVVFSGAGTLVLEDPAHFTGTISDSGGSLTVGDEPDLIGFDTSASIVYAGTTSGGTITVSEANHETALIRVGANSTNWSAPVDDGHGGILIHDPPDNETAPAGGSTLIAESVDRHETFGGDGFVFRSEMGNHVTTDRISELNLFQGEHPIFGNMAAFWAAIHDEGHSFPFTADPNGALTPLNTLLKTALAAQHTDFHLG